MDEDKLFYSRLCDLDRKRWDKNVPVCSKFVGIEQQADIKFKNIEMWGGYEGAQRKIVIFLPDWAEDASDFYDSVSAVKIVSSDKTVHDHRDYLGSVMGLGVKREVIGDIAPVGEYAVMFCLKEIAPYIKENLTQVGRSSVTCSIIENPQDEEIEQNYREITGTVSSCRIDCIVSFLKGTSRGKAAEMLKSGLVKINAKETQDASKTLRSGDIISVRGLGKFIFDGEGGKSKKGRSVITVRKLV